MNSYPDGLPKKYHPVADEWRRLGWKVEDFGCFDYGDQLKLVIARDSVRKFALLHAECEEVVFDVLDTPWWASVQKRKEQEFQAAVNERNSAPSSTVNYGEMSERQVAEFVADASKEAPEWMTVMSAAKADIEATTEMHDVPLSKKPDDELMQIAKEQNAISATVRNLVVENRYLRGRVEFLDKYVADTLSLTAQTPRKES